MTLRGLKDVVVARNAEITIADSMQQLKFVMNDRSQDVRATFFEVLQFWMTNMDIKGIRIFESNFILFLLNGIADENQEISTSCRLFLEEHGNRMRDALKQLGDDVEMAT